jgi:hypothetical protein
MTAIIVFMIRLLILRTLPSAVCRLLAAVCWLLVAGC